MRWKLERRAGLEMTGRSSTGEVYEIRRHSFESMNRTRHRYTLWMGGNHIGGDYLSAMEAQVEAEQRAGEHRERRTDESRRFRAESEHGEVWPMLTRKEVLDLIAGRDRDRMTPEEKAPLIQTDDALFWNRRVQARVQEGERQGERWTITEL